MLACKIHTSKFSEGKAVKKMFQLKLRNIYARVLQASGINIVEPMHRTV